MKRRLRLEAAGCRAIAPCQYVASRASRLRSQASSLTKVNIVQQVKIFKGIETDLRALEDQVNDWLLDTQVQIISMVGNLSPQSMGTASQDKGLTTGSFAPSDVLLIVLYEKM